MPKSLSESIVEDASLTWFGELAYTANLCRPFGLMNLNYSESKALPWAGLSGLFEAKHRIFRPTACDKPA